MFPLISSEHGRTFEALGLTPRQLDDQVAVVTGAARGIGKHTARALAALGAKVVLADISPDGEQVARQLVDDGAQALFVQTDVGDPAAVDRLLATTQERFGPVDILINNAARLHLGPVLEQPLANWHEEIATNFLGPLTLIQGVVPGMLERQHGVVLSLISLEGMPFMGPYCANKMALRSMMLTLGKEIPPDAGVSALSVMPGAVNTPLVQDMIQTFARLLGIDESDVRAQMSNNPGYGGLVPVEHTAASLAWFCVHARQFHGQFVDGYLPMSRAGLIDVGDAPLATENEDGPAVVPDPSLDLRELIRINRSLENRIQERTRELEDANVKLQEMSLTDPLTGLWNRRYADIVLADEVSNVARMPEGFSERLHLVMVDIDHFKRINDTYGHMAGDIVLKETAEILRSETRGTDKIVRWGGEEFMIFIKAADGDKIERLVERIRSAVEDHAFSDDKGNHICCTCSLGYAGIPLLGGGTTLSWRSLALTADQCLYAAKHGGRNSWSGIEFNAEAVGDIVASSARRDIDSLVTHGHARVSSSREATRAALLETSLPDLTATGSIGSAA